MESLRTNAAIREMDPVTEIEFPSPPQATEPVANQPGTDGLAYLRLLWEKRRLLYRVAAWAFAVSAVVAFLIPNQYESSISIMPPDSMNGSGAMLAALATKASPELAAMAGGLLGMRGSGALFVDLFRSRSVQDNVVDRLDLQKVYRSRFKQDARKRLNSQTDVSEDRKSGVISLTVTDMNPQRARDIAQEYVEELNRLLSQVSTSSARRERIFIEQRLTAVKSDLEDAEKQFGAFASKNSTLDIKEQTKAMVESAGLLQGQLIAAQSELQSLEQIYTPNNVRVRSLQARVDELKRQLQKIEGTDASLVSSGVSSAGLSGAAQSDEMYPPIRKLPLLGVEWADLYRRMKIQETVYELLNQQYELARIQEAKEIPTVNIVDPANVPERKSSPHRLIIILALTLLSIVGAAAWIVGSERWERVDPDDPGKMFAEDVWKTASDRGAGLLHRLAPLRMRKQSPEDPDPHKL
jgi:capsule polysaccharide export protein KpsE/RkpR